MKISASRVFHEVVRLYNQGYRKFTLPGGSRSTKTYTIIQFACKLLCEVDNWRFLMGRETLKITRETILTDFEDILETFPLAITPEINPNRNNQLYYIRSNKIRFKGMQDYKDGKGSKYDFIFLDEGNHISKNALDEYEQRMTDNAVLFVAYNPDEAGGWVEDLKKSDKWVTIHSTMFDNPFLSEASYEKLMSYKPTDYNKEQGTSDPRKWKIYGLGIPAEIDGLIYSNDYWDWFDNDKIVSYDKHYIGIDWGFVNSECVVVEGFKKGKDWYFYLHLYETNIMPTGGKKSVQTVLDKLNITKNTVIVCDNDQVRINYLRDVGYNAMPVKKISITQGIEIVKECRKHIHSGSTEIMNEKKKYQFKYDTKLGRYLDEIPKNQKDHALDAIRYIISHDNQYKDVKVY